MGEHAREAEFDTEYITPENYLAGEQASEIRHEFVDGVLYAMTGASANHGRLAVRLVAKLENWLSDKCTAYAGDMKVHVKSETSERYYYPDIVVTCDPLPGDAHVCEKPIVIVEVLSPSTERADRDEKFDRFKTLESFMEYVLVRQDVPRVEVYRRLNGWRRESFFLKDDFTLDTVGITFSVEDLYRRVQFGTGGEA